MLWVEFVDIELGCTVGEESAYDNKRLEWSSLSEVCCDCECNDTCSWDGGGSLLVTFSIGAGESISLPNGSNSDISVGCRPIRRLLRLGIELDESMVVEGEAIYLVRYLVSTVEMSMKVAWLGRAR